MEKLDSCLAPNQTLVHELAHKFDFENGKLSQTTEWENLYNKYKNQNVLTTYSKTDPQEFFADAVSVYFFKNYVTNSEYYEYIGNASGEKYRNNVVYPEDIKAFIKEHLLTNLVNVCCNLYLTFSGVKDNLV